MNINTASIYANQGYKIRRTSWVIPHHNDTISISFKEGGLIVNGDIYFIFTASDLLADDWEIIQDANG